ncbi:MAG: HAD family hydrolase [Clostridia bacterium]|nr:HAD family hydrolase [Clostridia bacterium]MCL6522372.1 haloacid dehalogenase-like hydrolase [Bacillota bacterium]
MNGLSGAAGDRLTFAFDMDGTLLLGQETGFPAGNRAVEEALRARGRRGPEGASLMGEAYRFTTTEAGSFVLSKREQIRVAMALAGLPPDEAEEERLLALFLERALPHRRADPAAPALLEALRARGHRAGVATAAPADVAEPELHAAGLDRSIDFLLTFREAGAPKGTPGYARALRRLAGPGPLVMVGDSETDVLAGRLAGAVTVLVERGPYRGLEPDHRVRGLEEILPLAGELAAGRA